MYIFKGSKFKFYNNTLINRYSWNFSLVLFHKDVSTTCTYMYLLLSANSSHILHVYGQIPSISAVIDLNYHKAYSCKETKAFLPSFWDTQNFSQYNIIMVFKHSSSHYYVPLNKYVYNVHVL